MQMAIRALGWAAKLLWIIMLAIIITIAYSATQINVAFGEPTTTVAEQAVTISWPISVRNAGLYDLTQLNVTTRITDQHGHSLVTDSTLTQIIPKGSNTTMMHTTVLNVTKILDQYSELLFNDTTFTEFQYVSFNYANAIPLNVRANQTMQWGAPLSNLVISNPTYTSYNTTYPTVAVQLHFENHNQYLPVNGTARIEIFNVDDVLIGTGAASINAQPGTSCTTQVNILLNDFQTTPPSEMRLFFETSTFNYGPRVVLLG